MGPRTSKYGPPLNMAHGPAVPTPCGTRPIPSAPSHPSLTPAATSSGYLALWRIPVCLGAPRLTVVYRLKFLLGLLEQRLARCSPPSCARSG